MRHRKAGRQLSRNTSHRRAVLRNLVTSLFKYEEISTTYAKAKEVRPIAEKMITLAKRGDLHARRQALSYILEKAVAHKLFDEMKGRFSEHQGGLIRILKTENRTGDNAPLAIIQILTKPDGKGTKKTAKKDLKAKESRVPKGESEEKEISKDELETSAEHVENPTQS